jgi:hypothetical protein
MSGNELARQVRQRAQSVSGERFCHGCGKHRKLTVFLKPTDRNCRECKRRAEGTRGKVA